MAYATFAAGCFWGVEAAFRALKGVTDTSVGYTGGKTDEPTYEQVCTGKTGHAEAVRVTYDPERLSYETLLETFWACHDPTQLNRQGPDVGTQYRSAIFFHDPNQEEAAHRSLQSLERSGKLRDSVKTVIEAAGPYWPAEDYHQQYLAKRGIGVCHF